MKRVIYRKKAEKVLRRLPPKLRGQIRGKIKDHAMGRSVNITRLTGGAQLRIRCGDWRVIIVENSAVVDVIKIAPRGDVYKGG